MANRTDGCEEIVALIAKFKVNKGYLAEQIGVEAGNFSRKYANSRNSKGGICQFTSDQKGKLEEVLKNIGKDLVSLSK